MNDILNNTITPAEFGNNSNTTEQISLNISDDGTDLLSGDLLGDDLLADDILLEAVDISKLSTDDTKYKCFCINVKLSKKIIPLYLTSDLSLISKFVIDENITVDEGTLYALPLCVKVENMGLLNKLVSQFGSEEVSISVKEIKEVFESNKFEVTYINLQLGGGGDLHA